ncbi:SDR family oxidoreductase [Pseudomonas sp. SbB1]|jgi:UDP-glucose 4-epimerase|uniref:NAD-dependent epimerase/dehydratase n=1 Tax=Pseudomonas putida (strain GB-1) TaxID=76869 RepID=B0KTZ5_PSEPG|nr:MULTISPECIES: SDR family oxidoreductase [Pseudomonas]ABY97284.1 NAD-dependent epimerase/dehydratase [Pseudomonas putida GB-1]MBP0707545.1 SDR family oxidoreductase [Pseudomonas sp. T34]MCK2186984.1 SDR family oxidoreductase [Pseudomonas sp. MB04B]MDD2085766.1 SDR family oxidoreductase [Pseudomonas putida]MDD2095747.1 SDR family oxidoreductase [Pseudomonas putida]
MNRRVFLTGASGFVGSAVLHRLLADGMPTVATVRGSSLSLPPAVQAVPFDSFEEAGQWGEALRGCDTVIHCAARVHVMNDTEADPLSAFRKVNVQGTMNLARQAVAAGVKRFVFISSIKVNGEGTAPGQPYTAHDRPQPQDPYGISKMEAEAQLLALAQASGLEVVIIRPVLVYGPGVKANFQAMMRWLNKGVPLPFGAIDNRRSLVALDNLVDLIVTCTDHPAAVNQVFLVSDGEDLSTTALLRRMAQALGAPARLLPVPGWVLSGGANLLGRTALSKRLCGSLQVDIEKTRKVLGWRPPVSVDAALRATAQHFQESSNK